MGLKIIKKREELKILIVDDEKNFFDAMSLWLRVKGYLVQTVENGHKAIDIIKENKSDLFSLMWLCHE